MDEEKRNKDRFDPADVDKFLSEAGEELKKMFPHLQVKVIRWCDDVRLAVYDNPKKRP